MDADVLHRHGIDPQVLPHAPADPSRAAWRFRLNVLPRPPCAVCGGTGVTVQIVEVDGPRWLDLCWPHARALNPPRPGPVQAWTDGGGWQRERS